MMYPVCDVMVMHQIALGFVVFFVHGKNVSLLIVHRYQDLCDTKCITKRFPMSKNEKMCLNA